MADALVVMEGGTVHAVYNTDIKVITQKLIFILMRFIFTFFYLRFVFVFIAVVLRFFFYVVVAFF